METVAQTGARALEHHRRGELEQAEHLYGRILRIDPANADALHLLGVVAHQRTHHAEAVERIQQAIALDPAKAAYHVNLATAYRALGQLDKTVECYRRALELDATSAEAHNNLGNALKDLGQNTSAIESYLAALRLDPGLAAAYVNLGNCLQELGHLADAVGCYHKALRLREDDGKTYFNLANAVRSLGYLDEAMICYRKAIALKPDYAEAHMNLGSTLKVLWRETEAIACYERALAIEPQYVMVYQNLGTVLKDQGRCEQAAQCFRRALQLQPDQPFWELKLAALCPTVFESSAQIDAYRVGLHRSVNELAARHLSGDPAELVSCDCHPPFNLQFHGRNDRSLRQAYAKVFESCFHQRPFRASKGGPRIGIVVTRYAEKIFLRSLGPVLERLHVDRFDVQVLCANSAAGKLRSALKTDRVQVVALPDAFDHVVQMMYDTRFDVLYFWEIGTSTLSYFLPFCRLAPIQCTSWGIQVTSGVPQMDYYLSNELVEPEDAQSHYSEKLLLARTLLTYQTRARLPESPKPRKAFGLSADQNIYLCAQQLGKFHPDFDPVLAGVLRQDPHGVLVITNDRHGFTAEKLKERFAAHMSDVADRIVFVPEQNREDYLSLVNAADVLLDPIHFGGVNTTYDGLSLGKPIVTLPSAFHRGRYTLGCYCKMGLTDCVVASMDDYVDTAVRLGTDAAYRDSVSEKIAEASDVLFQDEVAVHEHQRLFERLIIEAREGC